ncbi:Protein abnormal spindle [Aphelenchoides besseyi]|nr:Protein abnormal spindle [Aphelenchoides besseyi]KAI6198806.1 Protein abnormal spindle [Aphelenchoides besseyi]
MPGSTASSISLVADDHRVCSDRQLVDVCNEILHRYRSSENPPTIEQLRESARRIFEETEIPKQIHDAVQREQILLRDDLNIANNRGRQIDVLNLLREFEPRYLQLALELATETPFDFYRTENWVSKLDSFAVSYLFRSPAIMRNRKLCYSGAANSLTELGIAASGRHFISCLCKTFYLVECFVQADLIPDLPRAFVVKSKNKSMKEMIAWLSRELIGGRTLLPKELERCGWRPMFVQDFVANRKFEIRNLVPDFSDGVILSRLIENLITERTGRFIPMIHIVRDPAGDRLRKVANLKECLRMAQEYKLLEYAKRNGEFEQLSVSVKSLSVGDLKEMTRLIRVLTGYARGEETDLSLPHQSTPAQRIKRRETFKYPNLPSLRRVDSTPSFSGTPHTPLLCSTQMAMTPASCMDLTRTIPNGIPTPTRNQTRTIGRTLSFSSERSCCEKQEIEVYETIKTECYVEETIVHYEENVPPANSRPQSAASNEATTQLNQLNEELCVQLERSQMKNHKQQIEVDETQQKLEELTVRFQDLQSENRQLTVECENLKTEKEELTMKRDNLDAEKTQMVEKQDALESTMLAITKERDDQSSEIEQLKAEIELLNTKLGELDGESQRFISINNDWQEKYDHLTNVSASTIEQLEKKIADLETERNEHIEENFNASEQIRELKLAASKTESELNDLKTLVAQLREQVRFLSEKLESARSENSQLAEKLSQSVELIIIQRQKLSQIQNGLEDLRGNCELSRPDRKQLAEDVKTELKRIYNVMGSCAQVTKEMDFDENSPMEDRTNRQ